MYCQTCGTKADEPTIINGAKVCPKCGCVIERADTDTNKKETITASLIFVIIILLIVLSMAVGLFIVARSIGIIAGAGISLLSIIAVVALYSKKQK